VRASTAVAVTVLVLGGGVLAGCGGDEQSPEPALCGSVNDLGDAVGEVSDIDFSSSGALTQLKKGMDTVGQDLQDVQAQAKKEFSAQMDRAQQTYDDLSASVLAATNDPSAAALKSVRSALSAFNDEAQTLVSDVQTTC
jgi:hypothetical protein